MKLLSDDDLNLREMTMDEIERAFDLWFDLAQHTNDFDPPYTHGVFVRLEEPGAQTKGLHSDRGRWIIPPADSEATSE